MRLTLVRHGETPANVRGELDTAPPGPGLTERGEFQATALVERFADTAIDAIYASRLVRTQYTAAPLAADRGLQVVVRSGLREFDVGDLEGRSDPEAILAFVEVFKAWILGDIMLAMPGGETGQQVLDRFDTEVDRIIGTGDESVVVFSHGGALRIWAAARARNIDTDFALSNYLVNTGVIVLDGDPEDGWHCSSWDLAPARHT